MMLIKMVDQQLMANIKMVDQQLKLDAVPHHLNSNQCQLPLTQPCSQNQFGKGSGLSERLG